MTDFINNLKYKFKHAGIVEKLIYANLAVFILVFILNTFTFLFKADSNFIVKWFAFPSNTDDFVTKPWTIVTYGFLHTSFIHLLLNLIALFFIGNLFKQYFTSKQLLNFYILGTVLGGLIFMVSYNFFPVFANVSKNSILLGASAGVSAIFIGIASYIPEYQVKIPLIGFIKLWVLGAIWVALDIIQIPAGNAGGHLAHLGGSLFGFVYINYANNKEITIFSSITDFFKKSIKKQKDTPLKTVYKSGNKPSYSSRSKSKTQQEIDTILDKISKSGYETLTKEEKEFLFKQGKN
ncbi:rhomboid family intramembrane serine protease [Tenacibaculum sp. 190524A02b]|uniref:Rhomboid family intramembrane serine protease n=1 Tax=Tenacibaculum vairaonense TaxID=3137860 RepID=A0ABM9PN73_9FLAO